MDIEFIICWEDNTWTTESYFYDNLPYIAVNEIDFNKVCEDRLGMIIDKMSSSDCHRGGPVHVGIYHSCQEELGS